MPQAKRSQSRKRPPREGPQQEGQPQEGQPEDEGQNAPAVPRNEPHPKIVALALGLARDEGAPWPAAAGEESARTKHDDGKVANALANRTDIPELYTFGGYLGGLVDDDKDPTEAKWQLLYLDAKLLTWLLVDQDSIVLSNRVDDRTSPFGSRDYVWVKSDASVSQGEGPPQKNEIQARFLRGDFVSAADFAASVTAGTYSPPTGPSCPITPGCCGKKTR